MSTFNPNYVVLRGRAENVMPRIAISSAIIAETADTGSALFNPGYGRAVYAGLRFVW
jgi:iron complex outermembrane receptor protein